MEDFIRKYYHEMKEYLQKASLTDSIDDLEIISYNVKRLEKNLDNELNKRFSSETYSFDGEDAIIGLLIKYERFYGEKAYFYNRDKESNLAVKLDYGFGCNVPPCPYSIGEFSNIQNKITEYITQRERNTDSEISKPLITGVYKRQLPSEKVKFIIDNLTGVSHHINDYVDFYDNDNWNWAVDCKFIIQYVFEKAAELTYYVAKGKDTDGFSYDIKEAFSYFQLLVPEDFQEIIDSVVGELNNIVMDLNIFIDENKYYLCDKETWFRPIIFNFALTGMLFTLEQSI